MLRINTTTRVVMIVPETVAHIFERRSFSEAVVIMVVLARNHFDPLYCGLLLNNERLFFVVEQLPRADHRAVIGLKLVGSITSLSGSDEVWVSTGYVVNDYTLRRVLSSGRFAVLQRTRDR
jgi:hypothetical protein